MILDAQNLFSDAQSVTGSTAAASTNYIDLSAVRDIGNGKSIYIGMILDTAVTGGTLTVALEGDSTTTFTPDGTNTLFVVANGAAAGSKYFYRLAPGMAATAYRYLQLKYTQSAALTSGSVTAFVTLDPQAEYLFADGLTITG